MQVSFLSIKDLAKHSVSDSVTLISSRFSAGISSAQFAVYEGKHCFINFIACKLLYYLMSLILLNHAQSTVINGQETKTMARIYIGDLFLR